MYRHYQRQADKAELILKKADNERKAHTAEIEGYKGKLKLMEGKAADREELFKKLEDQTQLKARITDLEQQLEAEKSGRKRAEDSLELLRSEKPAIKRRAVNRFLRSDLYRNKLVDRYNGGWVAAHRFVCKAEEWDEEKWQAV